jgi:hypothetical protein
MNKDFRLRAEAGRYFGKKTPLRREALEFARSLAEQVRKLDLFAEVNSSGRKVQLIVSTDRASKSRMEINFHTKHSSREGKVEITDVKASGRNKEFASNWGNYTEIYDHMIDWMLDNGSWMTVNRLFPDRRPVEAPNLMEHANKQKPVGPQP